ncbi:hypothetical protein [Uliginosibacterium aquaticum]|uniref:DUF3592 domain-containing protein n=1 Tax=Uliginosibacterium aquaticum TaxID=2731212 RepID=A0ABX2IMA7_9RHOO|nr:hypothetical protein [Uliginosibacterium aquaticum]NSL55451.1 hypothetical protein [Uliginosibacterium aquaticum]
MTSWADIPEIIQQITPWIGPAIGVLIALYLLKTGLRSLRQRMKFEANAQAASARVLSLYETGNLSGDTTWVNLCVEIQCNDGVPPFVTTICESGPQVRRHKISIGSILQVRVLPEMPNRVEVLWK